MMKSVKKTLQEDEAVDPQATEEQKPKRKGPFVKRKPVGLKPTVASPLPRPEPGRRASDNVRLSTKPSSLSNDPMNIEFECDDFADYNELRAQRTFTITNESFIPLVDKEYALRVASDKRFASVVSRSCYRYVMCIHLYARYAQIRHLRGYFDP